MLYIFGGTAQPLCLSFVGTAEFSNQANVTKHMPFKALFCASSNGVGLSSCSTFDTHAKALLELGEHDQSDVQMM